MVDDNDIEANEVEYWASLGNLRMVERAVREGHDINAVAKDGYTAMHAAAENNHLSVLEFLVQQGAEIQPRMESGETSRDLAKLSGSVEAEEFLRMVEQN
ncbi:ankyrin repeat domain-containing protein [Aeoliella sp.]|uniref:ankyrin repeat domain-containing protein n=1 Tax=Aeoliella sp. TaxID=2795800 RepID=UPI003CCBC65E